MSCPARRKSRLRQIFAKQAQRNRPYTASTAGRLAPGAEIGPWRKETGLLAPERPVFLRLFGGHLLPSVWPKTGFTTTALGKLSGIHPKQLWSYMHGKTKPQLLNITF